MANPYTGEIYPLAEGELPKPGDLEISGDVAEQLQKMIPEKRIEELGKLRDQMVNKGDY